MMNIFPTDENIDYEAPEKHEDEEDESQENKGKDRIEELSNDLKELEEYTQESMDI